LTTTIFFNFFFLYLGRLVEEGCIITKICHKTLADAKVFSCTKSKSLTSSFSMTQKKGGGSAAGLASTLRN